MPKSSATKSSSIIRFLRLRSNKKKEGYEVFGSSSSSSPEHSPAQDSAYRSSTPSPSSEGEIIEDDDMSSLGRVTSNSSPLSTSSAQSGSSLTPSSGSGEKDPVLLLTDPELIHDQICEPVFDITLNNSGLFSAIKSKTRVPATPVVVLLPRKRESVGLTEGHDTAMEGSSGEGLMEESSEDISTEEKNQEDDNGLKKRNQTIMETIEYCSLVEGKTSPSTTKPERLQSLPNEDSAAEEWLDIDGPESQKHSIELKEVYENISILPQQSSIESGVVLTVTQPGEYETSPVKTGQESVEPVSVTPPLFLDITQQVFPRPPSPTPMDMVFLQIFRSRSDIPDILRSYQRFKMHDDVSSGDEGYSESATLCPSTLDSTANSLYTSTTATMTPCCYSSDSEPDGSASWSPDIIPITYFPHVDPNHLGDHHLDDEGDYCFLELPDSVGRFFGNDEEYFAVINLLNKWGKYDVIVDGSLAVDGISRDQFYFKPSTERTTGSVDTTTVEDWLPEECPVISRLYRGYERGEVLQDNVMHQKSIFCCFCDTIHVIELL